MSEKIIYWKDTQRIRKIEEKLQKAKNKRKRTHGYDYPAIGDEAEIEKIERKLAKERLRLYKV